MAVRDTEPSVAGQGCKCHDYGIQITLPWPRVTDTILPKVHSTAIVPSLYFLSYFLFLHSGTAWIHSSKPHRASFTVGSSSWAPATKTQKTWAIACSHLQNPWTEKRPFSSHVTAHWRVLLEHFPSRLEPHFQLFTDMASLLMVW